MLWWFFKIKSQTLKRNIVTQLILASILKAICLPLNKFLIFIESYIIEAKPALTSEIFCISALLMFLSFLFTKIIFFRLLAIWSIEFRLMSIFAQLKMFFHVFFTTQYFSTNTILLFESTYKYNRNISKN